MGTLLLVLAAFLAAPASAQTLYAVVDVPAPELRTIEPANGSTLSTIGPLTHSELVTRGRSIAMHPTSGTMYVVFEDGLGTWRFGTLNLATAAISGIAILADQVRDMTFDAKGKLWAVVGSLGPNAGSLVSIDTATGAVTLENGSLPTLRRNKIAYKPASDTLYLLGDPGVEDELLSYELYRLKPAAAGVLTEVPLSGATIAGLTQPAMVYDPIADLLRTQGTSNAWVSISLAGTVTTETASSGAQLKGLAWDLETTTRQIFADGFESGDNTAWSAAVP